MARGWMDWLAARHFDMQGIVNGIDYKTYDPETDPKIYTNYNASNFRKKKVNNKIKITGGTGSDCR